MNEILSSTVLLNNINVNDIEKYLEDNYGRIVRWAIIKVSNDSYKIYFSYRKQ